MTLDEFLRDTKTRNAWITAPGLQAYVRKALRIVDPDRASHGEVLWCLDLASVEAEVPGKGALTAFLAEVEEICDQIPCVVYVESIVNDRLYGFLTRRGYRKAYQDQCLYRPAEGLRGTPLGNVQGLPAFPQPGRR